MNRTDLSRVSMVTTPEIFYEGLNTTINVEWIVGGEFTVVNAWKE